MADSWSYTGGLAWTKQRNCIQLSVDEASIGLCNKWLETVVRLCQQRSLNLRNSPPYLLDTVPDLYEKLQSIIDSYNSDYSRLQQTEYLPMCICLIINKCQQVNGLFDEANTDIFNVDSHARQRLATLSLIFSHILKEIEALFPDNRFSNDFSITKPDAANWWRSGFGLQTFVSWQTFSDFFQRSFGHLPSNELDILHDSIDLTCSNFISVFEFDIFTRLFQPWSNILITWKTLVLLFPGYMAFMTYDQVKNALAQYHKHTGPWSYVYRLSCTKLGQWAIGYVTHEGKILQSILHNKSLAQALLDGRQKGIYRYPNGVLNPPWSVLWKLTRSNPQVHLKVSCEEHQLYSQMDSTFELCKICNENNKDMQLQPCGHLMCRKCLVKCQSSGMSQTCPFCRKEIKSIEEIVIDPYKPPIVYDRRVLTMSKSHKHDEDDIVMKTPPPVPPRHAHPTTVIDGDATMNSALPRQPQDVINQTICCWPLLSITDDLSNSPTGSNSNILRDTDLVYAQLDVPPQAELFAVPFSRSESPSVASTSHTGEHAISNTFRIRPWSCTLSDNQDSKLTNLLSMHPDMQVETANLLLNITQNNLDISTRIWRYFQPRPSNKD